MRRTIFAIFMVLVMSLGCLAGCGQSDAGTEGVTKLASGGTLILSVNPEIAIDYDENGIVTEVSARNDDALEIISSCTGLIGSKTREAVTALVGAIGEAGYFVEEVEGEFRKLTIEIEAGSSLPYKGFLDEVVSDVRGCVDANHWKVPMDIENESDYGITDYIDTDYGEGNDGVTDYDDSNYGATDYADTDYGEGNDGVTDYDDSNYGATNYADTDYGKGSDGVTNYDDSGYGNTNYDDGQSEYDDSGYGDSDY